ncbi:MAG: hypothetical protein U9Q83_09425, partial [Bacteroidota bacterium]|nr:hypothetical protein [Bacteroidota bacterium]
FEEYYQVDVTSVTGELVNSLESSDSINQIPFHENIQIENIILSQSGKYSEYFISKIMQIYDFSEENKGNFSLIKSNVEKWINIAYTDDDFSQEEQVLYINMLYVYGSSLDFWSKKFTGKPDEDDYWKVPVTDWVCGIFGSFAGPATAVIGYLSGSAAAAISIL